MSGNFPKYEQHPLGKVFPPLDRKEFAELVEDIRRNGLRNRITLFENKILDGWNRYKGCEACDVVPDFTNFIEFKGSSPAEFVISQNIKRRHLSLTQRVMLVKNLAEVESARAKERQKSKPGRRPTKAEKGKTTEKLALLANASAKSVERSIAIDKHAIPEIRRAVEQERLSLTKGAEISKLPHDEQRVVYLSDHVKGSYGDAASSRNRIDRIKKQIEACTYEEQQAIRDWLNGVPDPDDDDSELMH